MSTSPFASQGISLTLQPHIAAVAGLVPCAACGTMNFSSGGVVSRTVVRADHGDAREFALRAGHGREADGLHAGDFQQQFPAVRTCRPETLAARAERVPSRNSGSMAKVLHAFGLYFMVQEPRG